MNINTMGIDTMSADKFYAEASDTFFQYDGSVQS
jgi:hypothetical protein